jgi:hypothetical protein
MYPAGILYSNPDFDFVQVGNKQSISSIDIFIMLEPELEFPIKKLRKWSLESVVWSLE